MRKCREFILVFFFGGILYGAMELIFRGFTHWSMLIVGGICVLILYIISGTKEKIWKKWIMGMSSILTIEFVSGSLLNIVLRWNVWDYSEYPLNLYGQICLRFALLWLLLCIPANSLCSLMRRKIFR